PVGAHSDPGAARERKILESEQLYAYAARSSRRSRAAPDLRGRACISVRGSARSMNTIPQQRRARREMTAAQRIPYAAHVGPEVIKTAQGDYVQVFRLAGVSFECTDDEMLNTWHERLNVLWRNLASPQLALWAHV